MRPFGRSFFIFLLTSCPSFSLTPPPVRNPVGKIFFIFLFVFMVRFFSSIEFQDSVLKIGTPLFPVEKMVLDTYSQGQCFVTYLLLRRQDKRYSFREVKFYGRSLAEALSLLSHGPFCTALVLYLNLYFLLWGSQPVSWAAAKMASCLFVQAV